MNPIRWAAAGALTWTLLEYLIHDFLGHRGGVNNPFGAEHVKHHATTHYFAPAWKKALAAGPVVLGAWGLLALGLGAGAGSAYAGGLAAMYVAYEVVHRRFHTRAPRGPYGRFLRRHHFHHHFHDPRSNFGVTSHFWDVVFGTYVEPGVIRVPEKHAMAWLLDPLTGKVGDPHAGDYALAPRPQKSLSAAP